MESIAQDDTTDATKAHALQLATHHFLQDAKRTHVHSIAYRSHGKLLETNDRDGTIMKTTISENGIAYAIRNRNNPFASDDRYMIFAT